MLDPAAFKWVEVEVFREQGRWGARPGTGTNTLISVSVDAWRALLSLLAPHQVRTAGNTKSLGTQ